MCWRRSARCAGTVGIAACDISTGRMELEECAPDRLGAALARLGASELVAPDGWEEAPEDAIGRSGHEFRQRGRGAAETIHGVATLDGFGAFTRAMLAAAGGLIAYLDHVGRGALPLLLPPEARRGEATLAMDEATRASLEILEASSGGRRGSLIDAVDRCVTGAGARQLAEDLSAPLTDRAAIAERLELVQWLHDDALLREDLRAVLRALPDVGRALGRVVAGRGSPRDLGQLRDGLSGARAISDRPARRDDLPVLIEALLPVARRPRRAGRSCSSGRWCPRRRPTRPGRLYRRPAMTPRSTCCAHRGQCPPRHRRARGEVSRPDRRRRAQDPAQRRARLLHRGAPAMPTADGADSGFTHRQTMAGAVRFNALALHEEASRIAEAGAHALAAEESHFEELVAKRWPPAPGSPHRRGARPDRRRRRAGRARGRRRLVPPAGRRRAFAGDRGRTPSGGRGGTGGAGRALRRQRLPARRPMTGCG
jgi:DNA mismatch repair protein MutS